MVDLVTDVSALHEEDDQRTHFTMCSALELEPDADPVKIAAMLVEVCEEFSELRAGQPLIMFIFRNFEKTKADRAILGELALPRFMGGNAQFATWLLAIACQGNIPDYIMTLDRLWWGSATPLQREALVHHELKHAKHATDKEGELKFDDDGNPMWAITGHSLEEFDDTVERYGAWRGDIAIFLAAARRGGIN
jgi:hypothetical protein